MRRRLRCCGFRPESAATPRRRAADDQWRRGGRCGARLGGACVRPGLGEAVGQPAHADHQRRRRAGGGIEVGAQLVGGHADARGELGHLEARSFDQHLHVAGHFGALVGLEVGAGPVQNLREGLGDAVWARALQHLLDLAGGAAVRVALDGDGDLLPGGDVATLQRRANRRSRPEFDAAGHRCGDGRAVGAAPAMAPVRCQRHLASSNIATATARQRCLTPSQSAFVSDSGQPSLSTSDGCGSARRRTNWLAIHC